MTGALKNLELRKLESKFRPAATAEDAEASDMCRRAGDSSVGFIRQVPGAMGGPHRKIAKVAARAENAEPTERFEALSGRASVLRSCELSLECPAAGLSCWECFRKTATIGRC